MLITCYHLLAPTPAELDQIQRIYESNFPVEVRKPFSYTASRILTGETLCLVARSGTDPGQILAHAFVLRLPQSPLLFLEYLAVDEALQSQGIGSELFRFLAFWCEAGVVWEVEPPDVHGSNRPIRFYRRLGGEIITLSSVYEMPDFTSQGGGVPLCLMQLPLEKQPGASEVAAIIRSIYQVAYPESTTLRDEILRHLAETSGALNAPHHHP